MDEPDTGRITRANWAQVGLLTQVDSADSRTSVRDLVVGSKKTHEWASDSGVREIFTGLFGGHSSEILDRPFGSLSGGDRRRVGLAKLLNHSISSCLMNQLTILMSKVSLGWRDICGAVAN